MIRMPTHHHPTHPKEKMHMLGLPHVDGGLGDLVKSAIRATNNLADAINRLADATHRQTDAIESGSSRDRLGKQPGW